MTSNASYLWLKTQSAHARFWLRLSIFLGILGALLIITQAGLIAWIIDRIYLHHATLSRVSNALCILLVVMIGRAVSMGVRDMVSQKTAQIIKQHVRQSLLSHLMTMTPLQLAQHKTGALVTTLIEKIEALHGFFSDYLPQLFLAIAIPFMILILVWMQNWIAGIILLITGPLIPIFMRLIGKQVGELNQKNFQTLSIMSSHFLDLLQGLPTLTLFNQSRAQIDSVKTVSENYRHNTMRVLRVAFLSSAVLELFSMLSIAWMAVYLGLGLLGLIHIGFSGVTISLQHAFFILLLAPEFFAPLRQLGAFFHARGEAIGAATSIIPILNDNNTSLSQKKMDFVLPEHFVIQFDRVHFHYANQKQILKNLNLAISSKEIIAINGPSGSGKTSILNLLAKFIVPTQGEIKINHIHLNVISDDDWRKNIAFLTQHPYLFHGTIVENISLARQNVTQAELKTLLETDLLAWCKTLKNGFNTLIGEKNTGLSGGQAQRIALARILLKDAPIILLDEPTAHLDEKNVEIILNILKNWRGQKTVIIATHDARILRSVDRQQNI